jgi:hypothetical protein
MLDVPTDDLTSGTYRESDLRAAVGVGPGPDKDPSNPSSKDAKKDPKREKKEAKAEARARAKEAKEEKARAKAARRAGGDGDGGDGDDHEDDEERRSGRKMLIWALVVLVTLGTGTLIFLGYMNSGHYYLTCEPEQVVAERGRGFPPWGTRRFGDDAEWKPIKIPPEAECRARTTEDELELSGWYLEVLTTRANVLLTAREVTKVDEAAQMLEQALLHTRAPDRSDQRKDIERLLGDVGFWRASAKLSDAQKALLDAAKQFDDAALRRPRHAEHASAWAAYVRRLVDELKVGPMGVKPSTFPPEPIGERPTARPGTALPVEPGPGSSVEPLPVTPPDAGVPQGGVLL